MKTDSITPKFPPASPITSDPIQAARWIADQKLLAYPTESVWGMGCDPFDQQALADLLAIKQRPIHKGLIVLAPDILSVADFLDLLPDWRQAQIKQSWQQAQAQALAQTWLLPIPKSLDLPKALIGDHATLAVRVIHHALIARLCRALISPQNPYGFLVSTSCNPATYPPAQNLAQAHAYFGTRIGYLQGETLGYRAPSQIYDAQTGQQFR